MPMIFKDYKGLFLLQTNFILAWKELIFRQIPNELYNLLQGLCESLNDITPHIEVSVLEADKIISFINNNLPNINKWP